jgi:hypothetical protein
VCVIEMCYSTLFVAADEFAVDKLASESFAIRARKRPSTVRRASVKYPLEISTIFVRKATLTVGLAVVPFAFEAIAVGEHLTSFAFAFAGVTFSFVH